MYSVYIQCTGTFPKLTLSTLWANPTDSLGDNVQEFSNPIYFLETKKCDKNIPKYRLLKSYPNSADDRLLGYFFHYSQKIGFDNSCKLSPR